MSALPAVPYGRWPSPVSAELVARRGVSYDAVQMVGEDVYWIEGHPGGDVLVSWNQTEGSRPLLPPGVEPASAVHEYGGAAYLATTEGLWFSRGDDQRIYRTAGAGIAPVTPEPVDGEHRYADMRLTPTGLLVAVRERHQGGRVVNELVALPADGSTEPQVIAGGWDFYSCPRPNPAGDRLAWLTWRNPLMPWDGTWLWVADLTPDGLLGEPVLVAGGPDESVFQPDWSPSGVLHFVSDRSGWWNLYADRGGHIEPVIIVEAELGTAQWEFGYATYVFLDADRIAVLVQSGARQHLALWHPGARQPEPLALPYTSIKPYLATDGHRVTLIGSTATQTPTVVLVDVTTGGHRELTPTQPLIGAGDDNNYLSEPEALSFPTLDGSTAHGLLYWPRNADATPPAGVSPPLIVRPHPGPTANAQERLDPSVQCFTSRGFAVLDVNYRGSTGYGRAYRNALRGQWGTLDVTDCIDAVRYLTWTRRIDPARVAISGASAGAYTALRAISSSTVFAAAVARSAIIDPNTWRNSAPKFQAHHADLLLGPDRADDSAQPDAEHITVPVLLLHGERDTITPAADARRFAETLGSRATLVTFPDEGHPLRQPQNITQALTAELEHYRDAWRL